jgi:hypothetical protein
VRGTAVGCFMVGSVSGPAIGKLCMMRIACVIKSGWKLIVSQDPVSAASSSHLLNGESSTGCNWQ